jgi:predicted ATP-dependent endonuclease of OLD family
MNISLNEEPHYGKSITINENSVTILVGKNSSGKSRILRSIKNQNQSSVLLSNNYENIQEINTINPTHAKQQQVENYSPVQVSSIIAADPVLTKIFAYFFKTLFDIDLQIDGSRFKAGKHFIDSEADGLKSLFNLIYYLVSSHKLILMDEPERFLHPTMRHVFINMLSEVAKNYQKTIVISSHSNISVRYDLDNVFIFQVQKNPSKLTDIKEWLINLKDAKYTYKKDQQAFLDWFHYHTDILFSKNICLVEGISDQIVLNAIKNKLSFHFNLENININHVASSHHETGGKTRLHKFQTFLSQLSEAFVIADKDILSRDILKWYTPSSTDTDQIKIEEAKKYKLHILPKGEIEDYYFIDINYDICSTITNAKANKVSAAYEQASIIYSKSYEEVLGQFKDIVDILNNYSNYSGNFDILKSVAKDYIIEKYVKGTVASEHLTDRIIETEVEVEFKFASSAKKYKYPLTDFQMLKDIGERLEMG